MQYVYECLTCSGHGVIVYVFDDQTKRTIEAAAHRTLGHEVLEYQRKKPVMNTQEDEL